MSQLAQLKQKIKSIQATKKITHAVRLVSMSFYAKLDKQRDPLLVYMNNVRDLFFYFANKSDWIDPVLFPDDVLDQRPLVIVVATSRGLCGSLNSNLFRYISKSLFFESHQEPEFVAIGQKAIKFIKQNNLGKIAYSYNELTLQNLTTITEDLLEKLFYEKKHYSSVAFFSNELRSFFVQRPIKTTIIPTCLDKDDLSDIQESGIEAIEYDDDIIFEQKTEELAKFLGSMYLRSVITKTLFQSLISERAARFSAMDSSCTNAEKILERLTIQYNKLRQALITKEVAELSSGLLSPFSD